MKYAATTTVTPEKSRAEIEATLQRYGAEAFGFFTDGNRAQIAFELKGRRYRFLVNMPGRTEHRFSYDQRGRPLNETQKEARLHAEYRQRWRALALVIKAKLEAVESGISTLEDEFLAHVVLPDGRTMSEWARPQLALAYKGGTMPPLLGGQGNG